jgi:hypothetical protein
MAARKKMASAASKANMIDGVSSATTPIAARLAAKTAAIRRLAPAADISGRRALKVSVA